MDTSALVSNYFSKQIALVNALRVMGSEQTVLISSHISRKSLEVSNNTQLSTYPTLLAGEPQALVKEQ